MKPCQHKKPLIPCGDKENRPHEGKSTTTTSTQQAVVSTEPPAGSKLNEM